VAKPALGRDLGDLLSQARPARIVGTPGSPGAEADSGLAPAPPVVSEPQPAALDGTASDLAGGVAAGSLPPAPAEGAASGPPSPGASAARPAAWDGTRPRYRPNRPASAPPVSGPARRPALFYWLMAGDGVLLVLVAVLVFGGWMGRPWARATALGALVLGGAMSALAVSLPRRESPGTGGTESRVRVHLTRV